MGRNTAHKRRKLRGDKTGGGGRRDWPPRQDGDQSQRKGAGYSDIVKENEKYWTYYKEMGIIPEEDWEAFKTSLQTDLPSSFRIQGCHKDREQLMHEMETRFFLPISQSGDSAVFEPKPLPWYKGAYQTPMSRTAVRSHPILAQLHNFLVTEAELGNLSRQEAVSMIPPLLLAPRSDHLVFDMCAAPGSKTTQLIEMMHEETPNPTGMVVANDLDKKRCYMLIHQTLKRFHTGSAVITCEDAARMPEMKGPNDEPLRFDRVLCDVICSGDGTLRKNPEIWTKWTPQDGLGLHRMQLAIARRGAEKLKVGGRMVYSTCSMNPIEDEAIVAELLRQSKGALKLIDAHPMLPNLKSLRGVNHWKVFDKQMKLYNTPEEVDEKLQKMIGPSCFPPTEEEKATMNLDYCIRIAPHLQDTGGFFVALLEKVEETEFQADNFRGPAWKKMKMFKDEPFTFLKENDERWFDIRGHYGIDDSFQYQNLFSRRLADQDANSRQLFFANNAVKDFVVRNMTTVSIQNAGMKMFSRTEQKVESTRFRLSQEGIRALAPYMSKQIIEIPKEDMLRLLKTEETMVSMDDLSSAEKIRELQNGSVVMYVEKNDPVCTWIGAKTVAPYVSKEERLHLLRMMGVDCSEIEAMMKTKRKEKAALDRDVAAEQEKLKQQVKEELGEAAENGDEEEEHATNESVKREYEDVETDAIKKEEE